MIDFDIQTVITILLSTGFGAALKHWWSSKNGTQKKAIINDGLEKLKDGKVTIEEIQDIVTKL